MSISVVLVVKNQEKELERALKSVKFADEIIVVDNYSTDKTNQVARKFTKRVLKAPKAHNFVEPLRNWSIDQAKSDWVLVLDADEEISVSLAKKIQQIINDPQAAEVYALPRKNLIFGQFMTHSGWWPDYQWRLFKKGYVSWGKKIHQAPNIKGQVVQLAADEELAIVHHNYQTVEGFVNRVNRYTTIEAEQLVGQKAIRAQDLTAALSDELVRRLFVNQGIDDGLHGLALALLQAYYQLLVKLKVWQKQDFSDRSNQQEEVVLALRQAQATLNYWLADYHWQHSHGWRKIYWQIRRKWKI